MSDEALTALREAARKAAYLAETSAGTSELMQRVCTIAGITPGIEACDVIVDAVLAAVLPLVVEQIAQRIEAGYGHEAQYGTPTFQEGIAYALNAARSYAREALPAAEETR